MKIFAVLAIIVLCVQSVASELYLEPIQHLAYVQFSHLACCEDYIFVAKDKGLYVFSQSLGTLLAVAEVPGNVKDIAACRRGRSYYVYVTWEKGLVIYRLFYDYRLNLRRDLRELGRYGFAGAGRIIGVFGPYIYISGRDGLYVIEVSKPENPRQLGYTSAAGFGCVSYPDAFITSDYWSFTILDISDPRDPYKVGHYSLPQDIDGIADISASGSYLFLAYNGPSLSDYFIRIIDISQISNPTQVNELSWFSLINDIVVVDNYLFTVGDEFKVIDISDVTDPCLLGYYVEGYSEVCVSDFYAYAIGRDGLDVFDLRGVFEEQSEPVTVIPSTWGEIKTRFK